LNCVSFSFGNQGAIFIDENGHISVSLTNYQIINDSKITENSVFTVYIYKDGAILTEERPEGNSTHFGEQQSCQAEYNNCIEGLGFTNDPGFKILSYKTIEEVFDPEFDRKKIPRTFLDIKKSQWFMNIYLTGPAEFPEIYNDEYITFQNGNMLLSDGECFDAYVAVYYYSDMAFMRNLIEPDKISPKKIKLFNEENGENIKNMYEIPKYENWVNDLYELK
jgi:hypothetical protein